ncbi:MAG: sensor histidine kinase [Chloroflexota bacterium]|jgi:two-component system sensor histidine kinase UhpB|nr:sensor histidine kinase [Chloroflexota bacterium]
MTIGGIQWDSRIRAAARQDPAVSRRVVDIVCALLAIALFLGIGDPEIVLQALWLTVAIGAFVYGLRAALARIAIAGAVMVAFLWIALAVGVQPTEEQLEFDEWPLMVTIAVIVAVLADRVSTSARHYASLYRQASERLVTAHEDERARLARDLHDGVGQTLTAVILALDAVERELDADDDAPFVGPRTALQRARTLSTTALEEARDVAVRLRPTRVHEIGLGAALRNLAGSAGVEVELRFEPDLLPPGLLEPEVEIDVFRIVQEAVGNAARHSRARRIWIVARTVDGTVRLVVGDDGIGFATASRERGLGLDGMLERAAIHGGTVDVRSGVGLGTRVEIVVPISAPLGQPAVAARPALNTAR